MPKFEQQLVAMATQHIAECILTAASNEVPGQVLMYLALGMGDLGNAAVCVVLSKEEAENLREGLGLVLDSPEYAATMTSLDDRRPTE